MNRYTIFWRHTDNGMGSFYINARDAREACDCAVEELIDDMVDDEEGDWGDFLKDEIRDNISVVAYLGEHKERPEREPDGIFE